MADIEEKRENGTSLMFIGLAVWVAALLVLFFLPSGVKAGREAAFVGIIAALGAAGVVLLTSGYVKRAKAGPAE